jgi:hypothetical protein
MPSVASKMPSGTSPRKIDLAKHSRQAAWQSGDVSRFRAGINRETKIRSRGWKGEPIRCELAQTGPAMSELPQILGYISI